MPAVALEGAAKAPQPAQASKITEEVYIRPQADGDEGEGDEAQFVDAAVGRGGVAEAVVEAGGHKIISRIRSRRGGDRVYVYVLEESMNCGSLPSSHLIDDAAGIWFLNSAM